MKLPTLTEQKWHEFRLWMMFIVIVSWCILFSKCQGDVAILNG